MTTKINIFGLMLLLLLFTCLGVFCGFLIGDNYATNQYRSMYEADRKEIDDFALEVDTFRMKQDSLEALINTKCNENIKKQVDSIKKKRSSAVVQKHTLSNLSRRQLW